MFLHTGNPVSKTRTPLGGGRDVKGAGIPDVEPRPTPKKSGTSASKQRKAGSTCTWCGNAAKTPAKGTAARCGRCKGLDKTIAAAARYIGKNGLRPLGASLESDSEEERYYRETAAVAQRVLNAVKKKPSQKRSGARKPPASPPATPASIKSTKKPKSKKSTTPILPEPDPNDLNAINRKLAELRIRIEEQRRRGATDTGAGRARLEKLQADRGRLSNKAAALRAERASGN
ncbi:hypothetical protein IM877_10895 [Rhodococcus sp. GG48]|nr:hypothetical protein [Rhodococcus sp. GG48]